MKKINSLFLFFLLPLLFLTGCDKDEDKVYAFGAENASAPSLTSEGLTDITVTEELYSAYPAVLNWSRANFGKDVVVEYILEIDTTESFQTLKRISLGNNVYSKALSGEELSNWAINTYGALNEKTNEVSEVYFTARIGATVALENSTVMNYPDTVFSNTISLKVLPYYVAPAYPSTMYMIGEEFGGWNWGDASIAEMIPVNGKEGEFWCARYISSGKGFKWNSKKEWGGDFNQLGTNNGFTMADGNAFVAANGIYLVYINLPKNSITIEPAKVYGMGDCFGGWNTASYPFKENGKVMEITTTAGGELRIYAESSASSVGGDWWRMEFVILNGKIAYRGNGGDQERVQVGAGKTVTLDFNAGTGTIK